MPSWKSLWKRVVQDDVAINKGKARGKRQGGFLDIVLVRQAEST